MRYRDAKKLHRGDEVTPKHTSVAHKVVEATSYQLHFKTSKPFVLVRLDNGTTLYHDEIK